MSQDAADRYVENALRLVPGYHLMQRLAGLALAEGAGDRARILVVGAGGGQEVLTLAGMRSGWRFDGVDPSAEMLGAARAVLAPVTDRVTLIAGTVDAAPEGPYDGAAGLLVLHFLSLEERRHLLAQVHRRLRPGARLVVAHHSFPGPSPERDRILARFAAFAMDQGMDAAQARGAAEGIGARLPALPPETEVALLHEAGFAEVDLFFAATSFRGWVARRV